jgi:GTPase SAR1 family protein
MRNIADFAQTRKDLLSLLSEASTAVRNVRTDLSMKLVEDSTVESVTETLRKDHFVIAVVGVIKRGKSTLLNALLGTDQEVLSTDVRPESARLCYLAYDEKPHAKIHKLQGEPEEICLEDLKKYTSAYDGGFLHRRNGEKVLVENTKFAEVYYPNKYLKDGVVIVDTPGVDDPDKSRSQVTEQFISNADAVIFMIDVVEGGLKESELRFLKTRIINSRSSKGIIVVANKILALRRHQLPELDELLSDTQHKLENELGISVPVYPIDAKAAFEARGDKGCELWQKSKFGNFLDGLERMLLDNKGKFMLQKRTMDIESQVIAPALESLRYELTTAPENLSQLERQLADTELKIQRLDQQFHSSRDAFANRIRNLKSSIASDIRSTFGRVDATTNDAQTYFARNIERWSSEITGKLQNLMREYLASLQAQDITVPQITFHIQHPNVDLSKFYLTHKSSDFNVSGKALGAAGAGMYVGSLFLPGIGTLIGGILGFLSQVNTVEQTTTHFDELAFQRQLGDVTGKLVEAYEQQCDSHFQYFNDTVAEWFDNQRHKGEANKRSIEAAKTREQVQVERHHQTVNVYIRELQTVENKLILVKKQLGDHS